jgi:hypothetical protein
MAHWREVFDGAALLRQLAKKIAFHCESNVLGMQAGEDTRPLEQATDLSTIIDWFVAKAAADSFVPFFLTIALQLAPGVRTILSCDIGHFSALGRRLH